ncbi:hypothetical protein NQZ68_023278 [Dissostichus eleginoides]|nr:hypothetical protein NQZ68_023278 [Dissostichus eleginoides]
MQQRSRVCRADKGLSILSGYKETLLLAENNRHLVATSATIIKTDNFSPRHKQFICYGYTGSTSFSPSPLFKRSLSEIQLGNRFEGETDVQSRASSPSSSSSSSYGGRIFSFHHPFSSISATYVDRRVSVSPAGSFAG